VAWSVLVTLSLSVFGDGIVKASVPLESSKTVLTTFAARAQGFGSWLLLLALALVFVVSLWEQFRKRAVLAMMTLLACGCLLLAGRWQVAGSMMASLRWLLAISFALVAFPILLREQIRQVCKPFKWPRMDEKAGGLASLSRAASIGLFAAPALVITVLSFPMSQPGDIASLATKALFLAPLFILSLTLAAHAIRDRSPVYAFSAGLILNLAATKGCLFGYDVTLMPIIQANLITSAIFSLLWLTASRRLASSEAEKQSAPSLLLQSQIKFTLLAALILLIVVDARLLIDPWEPSQMAASMGGVWGWLAIPLPAVAFAYLREWRFERLHVGLLGVALLAAVSLSGCSVSLAASGWTVYHALLIGIAVSAWLMLAVCWKREVIFSRFKLEGKDTSVEWATGLGLAQLLVVVRGLDAPGEVWWTVGSFASLCLLFTGLAVVTRHRGYVYLSGLLCNLAVTRLIFWTGGLLLDRYLVMANVITLCLSSLIWLALDLAVMRQGKGSRIAPFHRVAARLAIVVVVLIAVPHWLASLAGDTYTVPLDWLALGSLTALLIGCLWDGDTDLSWRGLHAIGLIVIGKTLASLYFASYTLFASTAAAWSVYALATVLLWRKREALSRLADGLRIPQRAGVVKRMWSWLAKGDTLLAVFVTFGGIATVFNSDSLKLRLLVTTAAFALPLAFALLASGERRRLLIAGSIRLCLLDVLLWCWAWLPVGIGSQLINRLVIVMLIAEAVLIAYRLVATNQLSPESEWRTAWRDDLWWVAVAGLASLAVVLGIEVSNYVAFGSALIGGPVILAVLVTLAGLCLIGLAFAMLPGEDPFGLDERGRMRYIYAVEGFIVLTLMHVRVTMPWLFGGTFTKYWPLIVMALAFVGLGLSELFRRQGKLVLAEPLERTGVLLPLLPVIGFWMLNSPVPYSALLLLVGLFYGWLSVMRRSFKFGLLAALAANGGLWHLLQGEAGLGFSQHPQLWLIPAALSVLLAARINRDSLSAEQMSSIRYGVLITVYVSSTADIFLNGVDDAPWLPIVLAVLSVCGVIAGVMLRVRSFLFVGTAFLLLSMLTMIWSASVNLNWTWLWYVMGIALGVFIIYTFAMFERKREEMLRFVGRLKQWQ
jgi:hypothetical protein